MEIMIVVSKEEMLPTEEDDKTATMESPVLITELLRRKGDYLSYMGLYTYLWEQFN